MLEFLSDWKTIVGFITVLIGGGGLAFFFIPGLLPLILGTKLGRMLLFAGGIALAVIAALVKVRAIGRAEERAKYDKATAENKQARKQIDAEIEKSDAADIERELLKRVRRDSGR